MAQMNTGRKTNCLPGSSVSGHMKLDPFAWDHLHQSICIHAYIQSLTYMFGCLNNDFTCDQSMEVLIWTSEPHDLQILMDHQE